jgi:hypothetical protein
MANPVIKVWLREPRRAWKNDGGAIPHGFKSHVRRRGIKRVLTMTTRSEVVRRGWWVVLAGGQSFVFSAPQMRRLYSRVPL